MEGESGDTHRIPFWDVADPTEKRIISREVELGEKTKGLKSTYYGPSIFPIEGSGCNTALGEPLGRAGESRRASFMHASK